MRVRDVLINLFFLSLLLALFYLVLSHGEEIDSIGQKQYLLPDRVTEYREPGGRVLTMEATAYILQDGNGDGLTSTLKRPVAGRTVAVDPNYIPYGSKLSINGIDGYVAEDTGGMIKGNRIDIYFGDGQEAYQKAMEFGRQTVEVQIRSVEDEI